MAQHGRHTLCSGVQLLPLRVGLGMVQTRGKPSVLFETLFVAQLGKVWLISITAASRSLHEAQKR